MRFCPVPIRPYSLIALLAAAIGSGIPAAAAETRADAAGWTAAGLFVTHCAACHGERGDGQSRARSGLNPPPRDFTSERARAELDRERMIRSVTGGRPGTAMVAWQGRLDEIQIAAVVDYIREHFMGLPAAGTAAVMTVGGAGETDGPRASPATAPGSEIYRQNCVPCHGDRGAGATWTMSSLNPPPRDFTAESLPRERMLKSVTEGRPGTAMMSFATRLSPTEIEVVVDYIRAEFMRGAAEAAPPPPPPDPAPAAIHALPPPVVAAPAADMSLPFPDGLRGDPERGGAFYMENCHVCHGRDGDGRGPRATFIRPPPRDFLSDASRRALNRPALYKAIAAGMRGTVMPAWRTVLTGQEIADVAEFVFQAYIDDGGDAALRDSAKKKARD